MKILFVNNFDKFSEDINKVPATSAEKRVAQWVQKVLGSHNNPQVM